MTALFCLFVAFSARGQTVTAMNTLAKAKELAKQSNHREAADMLKEILNASTEATGQQRAEALKLCVSSLQQLDSIEEAETTIETAATQFPREWRVLAMAAEKIGEFTKGGTIVDGKFQRGNYRNQGARASVQQKDRVRRLQLLVAAVKQVPEDAAIGDRAQILEALTEALQENSSGPERAWSLLALTDLSKPAGYDDETGLDSPASGYPVDEKGEPIFFKTPATWDNAANDGERLFWTLAEVGKLDAQHTINAQGARAEIAASWFSVATLANHGIRFKNEDESAKKQGIAALHTLKDDETVAVFATGPKRLTLPAEWAFLKLWEALAENAAADKPTRKGAWELMAGELSNRRQYSRAAEALTKALALTDDKDERTRIQEQITQINGNWGSFESLPPQPAGTEAKLQLVFRNAAKIGLTARKVNATQLLADTEAYLRSTPQDVDWQKINLRGIGGRLLDKGGDKYLGEVVQRWEQELKPRDNHWDRRVEVATPLKEAGAWLVEGTFEGGHKARILIWIEDLVIVETHQADGTLYFIADAVTGAAVPGATVRFFGYNQQWKEPGVFRQKPRYIFTFKDFQATSDEHGLIKTTRDKGANFQWLIRATTAEGRNAWLGFQNMGYGAGRDSFDAQTRLYTITDRPVYRPGQEVKWKAWARKAGYDPKLDTNKFADAHIRATISNARGEKVSEKTYNADDSGAIDDVLILPDDATLGMYQMNFVCIRHLVSDEYLGAHHFRVEEYKKPEFEVKIDAPTTPVALGDAFEVKVKADYYFGGPVKEGKVKYKVQRHAHTDRWFPMGPWDWLFGSGYGWRASYYTWYPGSERWCMCIPRWPWMRWQNDPPELVAQGEAAIKPDGTFAVKVDTALAKELHGDEDHRYEIEAEVTDQSRRTIFGKGSVLAARRPYEVYVWLDRGYYQAGEPGTIRVSARTLDGKPVKAAGKIRLLRVTYGKDGKPNEEEVSSFAVKTGEDDVKQVVKWMREGQYRIAVTLKDEAGHEIEGTVFTTVRGPGFKEGRDFRFDDLELVTQKDEYAPGEEVEITLNTNRSGSTVALFLRTQNSVYPDPLWIKLEGKSTTYRFKLGEKDQPNIFIDAYTVSNAHVHQVTRQIVVPPKKRIASVELEPDRETYLPRQGSKVKVRVKDQDGKPFVGKVVLTAYDKALEYISGGSNQQDIRPFFWGWKRNHYPRLEDSLKASETNLHKEGEAWMQALGVFGNSGADDGETVTTFSGQAAGFGRGSVRYKAMPMSAARAYAAGGMPPPPPPVAAEAPASLAAPLPAAGADKASAPGEPATDGPQPMIRSNLADSAVWIADLTTDAEGTAELNFDMPDNLTTWKLRSWVLGPQTQVGEADVEVITRKNLMVRLQAPRFFVEKDEVVLSSIVHNEMDVPQKVTNRLEMEGGVLEIAGEIQPNIDPVTIEAHSEKRFDWRVKVTGEGEAKIRVKALAQKDSDAMEMTFPAYTHGMLKTDSWSLALRPEMAEGQIKIRVPKERKPEQSRLEVRYSPTLAMALVDALPYLTDYPYGCTEQTLNRFVPTVITLGVLKNLGVNLKEVREKRANLNAQEIGDPKKRAQRWQGKDLKGKPKQPVFDEDEVKKMARAGLDRLTAMRNNDGGWGWFPGGRESSPHITAVVLHGLRASERTGFDVNDGIIRQGVEWLKRHEAEELRCLRLPEKHKDHKSSPDNLDALIHSVLVEYKTGDAAMRAMLYEKRSNLSRYNVALLGLACHQLRETERRDMCLRNLRQFLKQDEENQTAWLELPNGGWWWHWYEDQIETQTAFLRLLVAAEPKDELASRVVKYLLNNRRNGTYWNSTKDTAAVIEALSEFAKASGESKPALTVEVVMDGAVKKTVNVTPETLFTFDGTFVLEGEDVTSGEHVVELRKKGEAPLYANAYLTVFSQEDVIPAAGLEVKVRRKFYKLIEEKPDQQVAGSRGQVVTQTGFKYRREEIASEAEIKSGDLVEVELTVESKNDYEYVIIEDMKPAGFEPVEVQSGWDWKGLAAYKEFRDEKVAFFAERLPRGTHNLSYRVKAEIPGHFSALPTKIEAMYAPELRGNAQEWKVRIGE